LVFSHIADVGVEVRTEGEAEAAGKVAGAEAAVDTPAWRVGDDIGFIAEVVVEVVVEVDVEVEVDGGFISAPRLEVTTTGSDSQEDREELALNINPPVEPLSRRSDDATELLLLLLLMLQLLSVSKKDLLPEDTVTTAFSARLSVLTEDVGFCRVESVDSFNFDDSDEDVAVTFTPLSSITCEREASGGSKALESESSIASSTTSIRNS
jgi:hypothetical protein